LKLTFASSSVINASHAPSTWENLSARTKAFIAINIIAVITVGLALDIHWGWAGQHAATIWTILVWIWLYRLVSQDERRALIYCTLIAGLGEAVLSLAWGLYDYQFGNIPLFVPFGHALLRTLGLMVSRLIPARTSWLVLVATTVWCIYAWVYGHDRFGAALFSVFAFCMLVGRAKSLYATMFILALLMELYGTTLGNWAWRATAPLTSLTAANPPFSAGAFYCLLDLLVLSVMRIAARRLGDTDTTPAPLPSTTK
jgi:hypothetical protein